MPVITAAAAAGQEWSVVAIAGVQEDIWPDLRLRARLLDPVGIAEVAAGRSAAPPRPVDARRAVLADEQRLFAAAVSRARNHLLVTAVQDAEQRPSHFLDLVEERDLDEARTHTQVPSPLDLRGLVGVLRREVVHRGSRAQQAALLLARLAVHAVPGADPDHWWGHALSETSPLWAPDERVRVSPSALTTFGQCELRWALQRAGGDSGYSLAAEVGTLIHDIAAAYPRGDLAEMLAMLDATWPRLGLGEAWPDRKLRADAESMLQRLVQYQASVPGQVEVEVPFSVAIDRADLVGRVDRVEYLDETEDGAKQVRIVDLKTSKNPVSKDDAQEHPQLAAYQAAVAAGAFGDAVPGGARLVYLGKSAASATMRDQARPEDDWTLQMVAEAAETMSGATFLAQPGPGCRTCSVRTSCPAVSEGGRVMGR